MNFTVTRRIEIDAGHRIMTHGSKCRHLHGHRYAIEAGVIAGALHTKGEQAGMVVDFGFLKEAMMEIIDTPCDHGFLVSADDHELLAMMAPAAADPRAWVAEIAARVASDGFLATTGNRLATKLYVVPFQPTAECLARHWFERLAPIARARSDGLARLARISVWETPNCRADYEGDSR